MKSATLVGYHGRQNLGDDIFFRIACNWLKQHAKIDRVFVAGYKNHVPETYNGLQIQAFERQGFPVARFVWLQTFFYALRSKTLLFAAGSIFTIQPFFMAYLLLLLLRILKPSMPIVAFGVSIGPLRTNFDRYWCGKLLALFHHIVLRDKESELLLREINPSVQAYLAYDLALTGESILTKSKLENPILGISLNKNVYDIQQQDGSGKTLEDNLVSAINSLTLEYPKLFVQLLVVCVDQSDGDILTAERLKKRLAEMQITTEIVAYNGIDPNDFVRKLNQCAAIITSRMHTGILAMMHQVPVFQITYARKIPDFYAHCGLGQEGLYYPSKIDQLDIVSFVKQSLNNVEALSTERRRLQLKKCGEITTNILNEVAGLCYLRDING